MLKNSLSIVILTALLAVGGCSSKRTSSDYELPNSDPSGSDTMKISPCACAKIILKDQQISLGS